MSDLITLYARKEANGNTYIYKDSAALELYGVFDPALSRPPRKGTKHITLNCWNWNLTWI